MPGVQAHLGTSVLGPESGSGMLWKPLEDRTAVCAPVELRGRSAVAEVLALRTAADCRGDPSNVLVPRPAADGEPETAPTQRPWWIFVSGEKSIRRLQLPGELQHFRAFPPPPPRHSNRLHPPTTKPHNDDCQTPTGGGALERQTCRAIVPLGQFPVHVVCGAGGGKGGRGSGQVLMRFAQNSRRLCCTSESGGGRGVREREIDPKRGGSSTEERRLKQATGARMGRKTTLRVKGIAR